MTREQSPLSTFDSIIPTLKPTLGIEDGYLKIGIPLHSIAELIKRHPQALGDTLQLSLGDESVGLEAPEPPKIVTFGWQQCSLDYETGLLQIGTEAQKLRGMKREIMGTLADNVGQEVHIEDIMERCFQAGAVAVSSSSMRKTTHNRISDLRGFSEQAVNGFGHKRTGLIQSPRNAYYMLAA